MRLGMWALALAVFALGCTLKPYIKRSADAPRTGDDAPALQTSVIAQFAPGKERSLTSLVVDAARNQEIERFGMEATELIEKELAR